MLSAATLRPRDLPVVQTGSYFGEDDTVYYDRINARA